MSTARIADELRERQNQTLLQLLAEADRPCTSAELAAALALPDGRTVAWHLRRLAQEGKVLTTEVGGLRVYELGLLPDEPEPQEGSGQ